MPKNTDAHELHRAVLEAQLDGLLYLDSGGFIRYANAAAGLLLDSSAADLVGTTFEYPLHNTERTELEITLKDQEKRILEARVSGSENGLEGHVLVQLRDISDLRQSNLIHHTFYDHLTDLPNRMLFKDRLKLELFHSQRSRKLVAVVVLNINRFKSINEALGYTLGDRILQLVASRLRETFRRSDTVARIGSDEFGLVLPGLNKAEDCSRLASKIITAFEEVCTVDRHELYLSVCLGIALHPDDGTTVDTLLKNAGTALDRARQQGRNTFQLYSEANQTLAYERVELERQLCKAMDNEEFEVYYQPQISLVDHRILGGEALLRWNSIGSGLVPAYHFITLAEETGLIQPIGDWVVRTVCRQIALWEKLTDRPFCITVNISPLQFSRDGFVDNLIALIKECGLDTSHLGLEITEHLLMKDVSVAVRDLRRLKELGISISIDDFGTGYSSLSYLRKFPIDVLKIDQSFVREVTVNQNDAEIASAIVTMAKALNLTVIAEGVESREQLEFFQRLGCDGVQGYLFSRAIPVTEFSTFLTDPNIFAAKAC